MHSVLRFSRAFIGRTLTPADDVWMVVDGGRITALGTGDAPGDVLGHPAGFAMPGLVDCHVHLALTGGSNVEAQALALSEEDAPALIRAHGAAHLRSGVTTVRDLGSPRDVVLRVAGESHGEFPMPRLMAGVAVSTPSGHGYFLASPAETVSEYERIIEEAVAAGATVLKVFATGGVVTSGTNPAATQMSRELLVAVCERAHRSGLRVAAHAHGEAGIANAIAAGVDTVEHFSYLADRDAALLKDSGTRLVSTFVATERFVDSDARSDATPETLAKILAHEPNERHSLRRAVSAGLPVAVGTDAGTTFNPHGFGMQEQARHLEAAGMSRLDVLRALTVVSAETIDCRGGVLDVGEPADILVLGADPSDDLAALYDITAVILGGVPVPL